MSIQIPTSAHFEIAGLPERYAEWQFSDYDDAIVAELVKWVEGDLWSLYLTGAAGTRKSSIAAAICWAVSTPAYFATPQTTVKRIRTFCDWWIEQAKTIGLLVLDDLGSYRATPHVHDTLLGILGARYDNYRKTIITSNASLADIATWLDLRLADRLREGLVMFSGKASKRVSGNQQATTKRAVGDYLKGQKPKFTGPP